MNAPPALVRGKVRTPELPRAAIDRPRLTERLEWFLAEHRVVAVCATAGAGKTTSLAAFARATAGRVAWLTVGSADTAPGRLIAYLEAALDASGCPVEGVATAALAAGVPHVDAAAILAEALEGTTVTLILDELEHLHTGERSWQVLDAFLRYAPDTVRIVLVSRRELPFSARLARPGGVPTLGDEDLAFTVEEAEAALAVGGPASAEVDPGEAVSATGGWVTGVLFEAWRAAPHIGGSGGEADPLNGYLAVHILDQLAPEDREFLVVTSLLDEVTAERARALGIPDAGERLATLRRSHLPASWDRTGTRVRCHSRFREYLLQRLARRGDEALRELRIHHARLLVTEGHDEEAVEEFLAADEAGEAVGPAARSIVSIVERLDFEVAERWIAAIDDDTSLVVAELMLAIANDNVRGAVRIADQLKARGERETIARVSDRAAALMAWSYLHSARGADVRALAEAVDSPEVEEVLQFGLRVVEDAPDGDLVVPAYRGSGPLTGLIYVAAYALGLHRQMLELPGSVWADEVAAPWRVGALRAIGRTDEALTYIEHSSRQAKATTVSIATFIGPEVLMDAGRTDEALEAIVAGRRIAVATGSLALRGLNGLVEAKIRLRSDGDVEIARRVLGRVRRESGSEMALLQEIAAMWTGFADLLQGHDVDALRSLREAVEGMRRGPRGLELPTAGIYLAEAEWRAGNESEADAAADMALGAAELQGSNHLLLQALADFPAVAARRIDGEATADSPWHAIARAMRHGGLGVSGPNIAAVQLQEFGDPTITVDGLTVRPRIAKSVELLAYLASRPEATVDRTELLDALFDGRADESSRSYLRQAIAQLRQVLGDAAELESGRRGVRLVPTVPVATESLTFERQIALASREQGAACLDATRAALAVTDNGAYFGGGGATWVSERRQDLEQIAAEAWLRVADLELTLGRYEAADATLSRIIDGEAQTEAAWRLRMRLASMLGDDDGVIRAYRGCEAALGQLGIKPAPTTQRLLDQLRR